MDNFTTALTAILTAIDILQNRKTKSNITAKIDENVLNEKDRYICKRKLLDGITFEKLAEEVDLSPQQTKARFYKAKESII